MKTSEFILLAGFTLGAAVAIRSGALNTLGARLNAAAKGPGTAPAVAQLPAQVGGSQAAPNGGGALPYVPSDLAATAAQNAAQQRLIDAQAEIQQQLTQNKVAADQLAAQRAEAARLAAEEAAAQAKRAADLAELERQREVEWRRQDSIRSLQTELSTVQNRLKVITAELNRIDALPLADDIIKLISDQHVEWCKAKSFAGWGLGCEKAFNATTEGFDVKAADAMKARKDGMKAPLLTEASELNTRQGQLLKNLSDLGNAVPLSSSYGGPVSVGSASVGGYGPAQLAGMGMLGQGSYTPQPYFTAN